MDRTCLGHPLPLFYVHFLVKLSRPDSTKTPVTKRTSPEGPEHRRKMSSVKKLPQRFAKGRGNTFDPETSAGSSIEVPRMLQGGGLPGMCPKPRGTVTNATVAGPSRYELSPDEFSTQSGRPFKTSRHGDSNETSLAQGSCLGQLVGD
ncbi:hypothetical protein CROQUDRAFT_93623 [Cronartium quercuum f. sp. fusiforme G11]|uniref:Uncharacterized protein n=1 Tax=Cronartium quercuum f. sp. fusiforme G11 TaxID=708437 RepID=A0A9P6NLC4_9BASI|nr:hypothetical protein CROQUDRAFT_93623 [Cronartium quercuum f. sp. fusiforme G11]